MAQEETPCVYLHEVKVNPKNKKVSIVVTDEPLTEQSSGKGIKVGTINFVSTSRRQQVQFGILVLKDSKTGKLLRDDPKAVKAILKWKKGKPLPHFEFSDNPVISQKTGQPTNLVWVVDCEE